MARKPRPIDPSEGPLQSFAYDLRALREAAGNPTYRALAGSAGFGATTLSDAAGGVRKPSLEVTLAFVGACRGDVASWERRWHELDDSPAAEAEPLLQPEEVLSDRPDPEPAPPNPDAPAPPNPDEPPNPDAPARPNRRRPSWAWWPAVAVLVVVAITGGLLGMRLAAGSGPDCPPNPGAGAFAGKTYVDPTRVREAAGLNATALREIPAGCALHFSGYCLGDVVFDKTGQSPDMRWFQLVGGGLVSSAVVHGNPPADLAPSPCRGSVPMPSSVALNFTPPVGDSDTVQLRATGSQLGIVGFAAYYPDLGADPTRARWHQIGITMETPDGFAMPWRVGPLRDRLVAQGSLPIVAVACLGGEKPTEVADLRAFAADTLAPLPSAPPAAATLTLAEKAACKYPGAG